MPRQLPWLNNGGGGNARPSAKNKPKAVNKPNIPNDIDDDFFDGTVLDRTDKGKKRADVSSESDDDALDERAGVSKRRSNKSTEDDLRKERLPSSSPPPIQDHIQPEIEYMRKGTKYDLRDDEWMMVEDEFLETAKLFTRHLHIAEYEKLKEQIQAKKKEQLETLRPTATDAAFSAEGQIKKWVKRQEKKQQRAIRDVFASQDSSEEEMTRDLPKRLHDTGRTMSKQPIRPPDVHDSDSNNLDASPKYKNLPSKTNTPTTTSASTFIKPALPTATTRPHTTTSRRSRATPFDMLDDYVPPTKRTQASGTTSHTSTTSRVTTSPAKSVSIPRSPSGPTNTNKARSVSTKGDDDDWGRSRRESSTMGKETTDRIAKRRAEREKEKQDKNDIKIDDIPTFLF